MKKEYKMYGLFQGEVLMRVHFSREILNKVVEEIENLHMHKDHVLDYFVLPVTLTVDEGVA